MVKTHSEAVSAIDEAELVSTLRSAIRGEVIGRGHPSYDRARQVWNGMIDRRPAVITRCADTADVVETVRIARRYRPIVSIRAGGHQVAGSAVCDDGLVIDLSAMKRIHVDATGRKVRAQGGVTWGELDRETQRHGLATTGGEVSTTGIAGFTLGGGMGVLMRAHGLACDNLRSIEIVTADGVVRTASRDENPDILWAARGGGRGIGVVTTFEFDLHPVGPDVAFAQVVYPYEEAGRILRAWSDAALSAPETVTPQIILWTIPADPAFAPELHNADVAIVIGVYAGPPAESERALAPLRRLGTPLVGDAAGTSDPTWGQGLSLALRDARAMRDALLASDDWDAAGHAYAAEHDRCFELVRTTNSWFTRIFLEPGPDADALRSRVLTRLESDGSLLPDTQIAGPDHAPPTEEHRRRIFE